MSETVEERECPFPECDWSREYDTEDYPETLSVDFDSEMHYEREHAGRVRVQVTLDGEQLLAGRDPQDVRERLLERAEETRPLGLEVAHVRTEVIEEADDHSALADEGGEA